MQFLLSKTPSSPGRKSWSKQPRPNYSHAGTPHARDIAPGAPRRLRRTACRGGPATTGPCAVPCAPVHDARGPLAVPRVASSHAGRLHRLAPLATYLRARCRCLAPCHGHAVTRFVKRLSNSPAPIKGRRPPLLARAPSATASAIAAAGELPAPLSYCAKPHVRSPT
jgi:hypothetical protein